MNSHHPYYKQYGGPGGGGGKHDEIGIEKLEKKGCIFSVAGICFTLMMVIIIYRIFSLRPLPTQGSQADIVPAI